jgi:FlaA1/EpsC-like NDP-sugar epimerase
MNEVPFLSKPRPRVASHSRVVALIGVLRDFESGVADRLRYVVQSLPRNWKRGVMIAYDVIAVSAALWLAYALRYQVWRLPDTRDQWAGLAVASVVSIPIFARLGMYRMVVRYISERALWMMIRATTFSAIGLVVVAFITAAATRGAAPRSVPLLFWAFSSIFVIGGRYTAKAVLGPVPRRGPRFHPTIIYGAGEAGAHLAAAIRTQRGRSIVAFIDENRSLWGHDVAGVRVFPPYLLSKLLEEQEVEEVILSMPSLGLAQRRQLITQINGSGVKVRVLPPLVDLVDGKYAINSIKEIDIDELLGRSSVPPDPILLSEMIDGRAIMVTGAGGSIGSELCRLIVGREPRRLILLEANEYALYQIERELTSLSEVTVVPVLASVGDKAAVARAIAEHGIEVIFHAAAHKHVPLVESNALEGIRNNVFGTLAIAEAALQGGVCNFVLISSDKAVRPTNVMGATKRWAERIVQQKAAQAARLDRGQRFCCVRFGNVLGSNGSVVPLFKEQIGRGGPITLTDPAMTRYFMSIHEAAELIVQAGRLSSGGDVFLLEMGSPILIRELAENMVRLAGFTVRDASRPGGDIEITVVGRRPGEKMFEELFYDPAAAVATRHPKILRATDAELGGGDVDAALSQLQRFLAERDEAAARALLFKFAR